MTLIKVFRNTGCYISALVDSEGKGRLTGSMDDIEMDQQEMDTAMEATPSSADPIHLTGALDESHQEQ
jgi:hypothetical protein